MKGQGTKKGLENGLYLEKEERAERLRSSFI